jgi:DNA-binding NtrC family response regulator
MRVLIVDDDVLVLKALQRILKADHEVVTSSEIGCAFHALTAQRFDVILCDMRMPTMSGTEFVSKLSPLDAARVIFMSGAEASDAEMTGPSAIRLLKPFTRAELLGAIETVAGQLRKAS